MLQTRHLCSRQHLQQQLAILSNISIHLPLFTPAYFTWQACYLETLALALREFAVVQDAVCTAVHAVACEWTGFVT